MLRSTRGFSLVEALIAIALASAGAVGLLQLLIVATTANQAAKATTVATLMAIEKMEQLRGLLWAFDASGQRISDTASDVTTMPDGPNGTGLSVSPANSLQQNVHGFCDFLSASGAALGTGASPPLGTAFVRRWSIEALSVAAGDTLLLQVLVLEWSGGVSSGQGAVGPARLPRAVRLVSVKTRKMI
jgi:type II secretory pathway pseudopilin PulG